MVRWEGGEKVVRGVMLEMAMRRGRTSSSSTSMRWTTNANPIISSVSTSAARGRVGREELYLRPDGRCMLPGTLAAEKCVGATAQLGVRRRDRGRWCGPALPSISHPLNLLLVLLPSPYDFWSCLLQRRRTEAFVHLTTQASQPQTPPSSSSPA